MLSQRVIEAGVARASSVAMGLDELEQLTREIQESVMAIRAQPVKPLFQRMSRIVREVADATGKSVRLKTEAQALLAEFQRKGLEAEKEAEAIIASAKAEAGRLATEAKARMEDFVVRRTKMAESKIAQAEAQALADVRSAAADAAVAAAEKILSSATKGKVADDLLAKGIAEVRAKLN